MAAVTVKRKGFGQVEPNHLSGIVTGQIYAQLPADNTVFTSGILEQGMFVKYDMEAGKVNLSGDGEWLLVYNEEKLPDPLKQGHQYYAMRKGDMVDNVMVPRLIKTNVGDIYTTNTFEANTSDTAETTGVSIDVGTTFQVGSDGYLDVAVGTDQAPLEGMVWKAVKIYTMPDGKSQGVKLQRIQ